MTRWQTNARKRKGNVIVIDASLQEPKASRLVDWIVGAALVGAVLSILINEVAR